MQNKARAHRKPKGLSEQPDVSRLDLLEAQLNTEAMAEKWWEREHPGIPRYRSPEIAKIRAEVARIKRRERQQEKQERKG